MSGNVVRASGGLVFRPGDEGYEILVVHRPRYDDWSLPKGKDDPGESPEDAAVREVEEETGVRARIVRRLGESRYRVAAGEKVVTYFAMRPVMDAPFSPNPEVDEVRWIPIHEAPALLTYARDVDLVAGADLPALARTGTVFVVRHAVAGDRAGWEGDDRLRPLTEEGRRQARALAEALARRDVGRVVSSPHLRCRQTVEPLAAAIGRPVEVHPSLAEGADWSEALALVEELAGWNPALCTHGDVIPDLLQAVLRRGAELSSTNGAVRWPKASVWALTADGGAVTRADYLPPPSP